MEMSFVSHMSLSSTKIRGISDHFHAPILLASTVANDVQSASSTTNSQSDTDSTVDFSNHIYGFNPTFSVFVLSLTLAILVVAIVALCIRRIASVSAHLSSDAQRDGQTRFCNGLDRKILAQFPIIKYQEGGKESDCAVCLTPFQQKENLRLLPQCNHSFHPECIDKWLESNTTCPLCRTSLAHVEKFLALSQEIVAEHEVEEGFVQAMAEPRGATSAQNWNINCGLDRDGEREALVILSRSSTSFRKAVQEMETQKRAPEKFIECENVFVSGWVGKIRRSRSTESFKMFREGLWSGVWDTSDEPSLHTRAISDEYSKETDVTDTAKDCAQVIDIATDSAQAADKEAASMMRNIALNLRACRSNHGVLKNSLSQANLYGS